MPLMVSQHHSAATLRERWMRERMRSMRTQLLAVLLLLPALNVALAEEPGNSESLKITHGPYLQGPRAASMTIVWFTNKKCVSRVEFGTDPALSRKAIGSHQGLVDANETRHVVQLDGLEPGKTYHYRVISKEIIKLEPYRASFGKEIASKTFSFRTFDPAKESFSFCVATDNHGQSERLSGLLNRIAWNGVDLMVLDGDMIEYFDEEPRLFDGFLDVCAEKFAAGIPMVFVRGNHETRGALARRLFDYFPTPEGRFYYSFNHGGVHFIVLDSGEDKNDDDQAYSGLADFDAYRRAQAAWLQEDIRSESCGKSAFRIALLHMPTHGEDWHGETEIRKLWEPLLNQGGVDLAICGHIHKNIHIAPKVGANDYDLVIGSPKSVIRVDVTRDRLTVAWDEPSGEVPKAFSRAARSRKD
jgi:acid phosphatase type 7